MQLTLLSPIATTAQKYIRSVHIFYLHHELPLLSPTDTLDLTINIASHPTEDVVAMVPIPLLTTVRNTFGRRADDTITSLFLNAHYLNLLPPSSLPGPLSLSYKRWPMTLHTAQTLTRLASQSSVTVPDYLPNITLPEPSPVPVYLKRLVTTYMQLKCDLQTITRLSSFYEDSHLIATPEPRTDVARAGRTLDYIFSQELQNGN